MPVLNKNQDNENKPFTNEELIKSVCKSAKYIINHEKVERLRDYSAKLEKDVFDRWQCEDNTKSTLPDYDEEDMKYVEKMSEIWIALTESINNIIDHVEHDLLSAESGEEDNEEVELEECQTKCGYCEACNDPSLFEGAEMLKKLTKENLIDFNFEDEVEHIQVSDKLELTK
jgi:hypothetical protein